MSAIGSCINSKAFSALILSIGSAVLNRNRPYTTVRPWILKCTSAIVCSIPPVELRAIHLCDDTTHTKCGRAAIVPTSVFAATTIFGDSLVPSIFHSSGRVKVKCDDYMMIYELYDENDDRRTFDNIRYEDKETMNGMSNAHEG
mmetsp:Transcript_15683/g.25074  ORF Transcript_15683/g.25074 Transcript_15683/m.25074 type:complete len:144 (+) Transcript_15683:73-504(+)